MVAVFLLLTYMAMQIISVGILNRLQKYSITSYQTTLGSELTTIKKGVDGTAPSSADAADTWRQIALKVQQRAQFFFPSVNIVVLNNDRQVQWTSGLGQPDFPPEALAAVISGQTPLVCPRPASGAALVWCVAPILDASGRVLGALAASTSTSGIYNTIQSVHDILFTWTLIALVVIGGLSLLVARSITGPIGALTRRARAMASGDFTARLPVQSHDEVGQLAQMFNHLGRRLQETLDEIRAEQRRAAAILSNMTDGIVAVDAEGRILLCNPSAAAMLEVEAQAVIGRPATAVMPQGVGLRLRPPTSAQAQTPVGDGMDSQAGADVALRPSVGAACENAGQAASSTDTAPLAISARSRHLLAHFAPLGDPGTLRGTVIVLQDVTARERLETMRKEFVANVSHELRTPVTTIKLYTESLLEWGLDDAVAARPKLEVIGVETDRMARLIGDLLQLSQLDHRGIIRGLKRSDVAVLARTVATSQQARAGRKGVELTIAVCGGPCEALLDPDRIVQVLNNLLINAIDFTPEGGRVSVAVGLAVGPGKSVV